MDHGASLGVRSDPAAHNDISVASVHDGTGWMHIKTGPGGQSKRTRAEKMA